MELSKKATETPTPDQAALAWNTTGIAHYRKGAWKEALTALEKADPLVTGYYQCRNNLFLALTHHRLGNKDKARQRFNSAVDWMNKQQTRTPELSRFRDEAANLLGIKDEAKPASR